MDMAIGMVLAVIVAAVPKVFHTIHMRLYGQHAPLILDRKRD